MNTNPQAAFAAVLKTLKQNKVMVDTRIDGIYIRLAGSELKNEAFTLEWAKVYSFDQRLREDLSNTAKFAKMELAILTKSATDPDNRPIIEKFIPEIIMLAEKFGKSGQSGGSAPYVSGAIAQAVKKLLLQEPICPMTGIDDEWIDVSSMGGGRSEKECVFQNRRCGQLFKDAKGQSWYLDAIIWKEENGNTYFGNALSPDGKRYHSKQFVQSFPFTPKTFYIDVVKEILPEDWTTEPFIEWDYYDSKIFEATGVKEWKKEKYRNIIKHPGQLNKAFKYYNFKPVS